MWYRRHHHLERGTCISIWILYHSSAPAHYLRFTFITLTSKRGKKERKRETMNTTSLPVLDSNTKHVVAAAMNLTTTALNLTTPICTLSPHARALSSVLTGFVSTVLTGISSGFQVAFQVAWVCWFAALRKPPHSLSTKPTACAASKCPRAASHFFTFMDRLVRRHDLRDWSSDSFRGDVDEEVGLLGWMAWMFHDDDVLAGHSGDVGW
jgi:hypothetical protein